MEGGDLLALSVSVLRALRLGIIFDFVSCTILIWDYILTFRMEVDLVWKSKWNFMTGLYFLQRYLPFIDTAGLVLYSQVGWGLKKIECRNVYYVSAVMMAIGFAASEMLLTFRTWAVWKRNQRLSIILPILYVLVWGSGFVTLGIYLNSVTFGDPPYPGFEGCLLTHTSMNIIFLWANIMIWDTLMLVLMLVPGIQTYRGGGNSALVKVVYRDGVIYYIYLFALSFVNILLVKILPIQYRHLLISAERVLHPLFASRVLLHIRAQAGAGDNPGWLGGQTMLTQIGFHHRTETECSS